VAEVVGVYKKISGSKGSRQAVETEIRVEASLVNLSQKLEWFDEKGRRLRQTDVEEQGCEQS